MRPPVALADGLTFAPTGKDSSSKILVDWISQAIKKILVFDSYTALRPQSLANLLFSIAALGAALEIV